jgi:hypothetical protein
MSLINVRAAMEKQLDTITPPIDTVPENTDYTPVQGTPYQETFVLAAEPDNPEFGPMFREQGIFQITLNYPLQEGSGAAASRADLIRAAFKRGSSFVQGGDTIVIERTPAVGPGMPGDTFYQLPVRIRWYVNTNS